MGGMVEDDYLTAIIDAADQIDAHMLRALKPRRKSPPLLYHYTSAEGLLGILNNRAIWASDIRTMNDMRELNYSTDLLRELAIAKASTNNIPELLECCSSISELLDTDLRSYAVCFSELADDLPQWRAYAGGIGGYAIGFDLKASKFHNFFSHAPLYDDDVLVSLIYNPKRQVQLLSDLLDVIIAQLRILKTSYQNNEFTGTDFIDICKDYEIHITLKILDYLLRMKSPEFESEHEWRVMQCSLGREGRLEAKYRANRGILRGYVEHPLYKGDLDVSERLPIKSIVLGPNSEINIARSILEECLTALGYDDINIITSKVPIRF
jgi:hypothetical protein